MGNDKLTARPTQTKFLQTQLVPCLGLLLKGRAFRGASAKSHNHIFQEESHMPLSAGDIRRIADLGRIDLSEEQTQVIQSELNDIFQMIEQIRSVITDGIEPMPNPHDGVERLREDCVSQSENREENMKNAPEQEDGYFLVPQVIE